MRNDGLRALVDQDSLFVLEHTFGPMVFTEIFTENGEKMYSIVPALPVCALRDGALWGPGAVDRDLDTAMSRITTFLSCSPVFIPRDGKTGVYGPLTEQKRDQLQLFYPADCEEAANSPRPETSVQAENPKSSEPTRALDLPGVELGR